MLASAEDITILGSVEKEIKSWYDKKKLNPLEIWA